VRRWWLAVALPLCAAPVGAAETPSATATPSKGEVGVGEVFFVDVRVAGPAGASWTFPEEAGDDTVELRTPPAEPDRDAATGPAAPDTHRYLAAAFALGEVDLPAIAVRYRLPDGTAGEVSTAPVKLRIASALPKDPSQQQLVDIREPQPLAFGAAFWVAGALVGLLVAGVLVALRRRRRPAAVAAAVPERPAEAEAREALDRLAASGALARGEYRAYYIALAEIAKRYLERRLGAPVLEMTSSETVAFLRDHTHGHGLAGPMRDLAGAADQVKFARGSAQREEAERHLAVARQMIDALEARLQPTPSVAAGEKVA
jgi:hypothetical protein